MDNIMEIKQIGNWYEEKEFCGHNKELYKFGNYFITLKNNIEINVIGTTNKEFGYYFKIISVRDKNKNRKYNSPRFFYKYISLVRDALYNYITKEAEK